MQSWPPPRVQAAAERNYLRDWLAAWVIQRFSQNQREYEAIVLGMQYDVPQTLELALRVLGRHESHHSLMYAALCVGKYGEDWHLPRVESLLDNEAIVAEPHNRANRAVQYEVQLRDMALHVLRLPIGSGVTEAACKIVFTQRFKQSGMKWKIEGGQSILDLRVIALSGIWDQVRQAQRIPTKKRDGALDRATSRWKMLYLLTLVLSLKGCSL